MKKKNKKNKGRNLGKNGEQYLEQLGVLFLKKLDFFINNIIIHLINLSSFCV